MCRDCVLVFHVDCLPGCPWREWGFIVTMDPCQQDRSDALVLRLAGERPCPRSIAQGARVAARPLEREGVCPDHLPVLEACLRDERPGPSVGGQPPVGPKIWV